MATKPAKLNQTYSKTTIRTVRVLFGARQHAGGFGLYLWKDGDDNWTNPLINVKTVEDAIAAVDRIRSMDREYFDEFWHDFSIAAQSRELRGVRLIDGREVAA